MADSSAELERIRRLAVQFGRLADGAANGARSVVRGIGDDAAILRPGTHDLVWTVDAQVEGVHFRRDWLTLEDLGWRSFVAAASDLFAMGAEPWCALSSLALPPDFADAALDALTRGQAAAAVEACCPIVGGNLSRAGELSVTTTLLGTAERPVRRDSAEVGDGVYLAGQVGLAGLGLRALEKGLSGLDVLGAIGAFLRPVLRVAEGRVIGELAHAAIDISDGLVQDAGHVALASAVAIVLEEAALVEHADEATKSAAEALGLTATLRDLLLHGGEDYALLATSKEPLPGFTWVGVVEAGGGTWLRGADGAQRPLAPRGYDHFA